MRVRLGVSLLCAIALLTPAAALAAPPPNDDRGDAQVVSIPSTVDGTTVESTRQDTEPASGCAPDDGSVWYRVNAKQRGRVIVSLAAAGDLDAVVDVYRLQRSQISGITCERTDTDGNASLDFRVAPDNSYLIRVSQLEGSASDTFQLKLQLALPAARPPGARLPRGGATGTLDRVLNPSVAYAFRMHAGVTYRLHLATGEDCTPLSIYRPHTRSFSSAFPVGRLPCGGYSLFTPRSGQSGVFTLLAQAAHHRGGVHYRLTAARAGLDDTTPGRLLRNYAHARGGLSGSGIDVEDLYRFNVPRRSSLRLTLHTRADFGLQLLRDTGHVLSTGDTEIRQAVGPGRYYVAVLAPEGSSGRYTLSRLSRAITHATISANGKKRTSVAPGQSVRVHVAVKPSASGPVHVVIERFDPLFGWQFSRAYNLHASAGGASVSWRPPSVGRYRIKAAFRGTRRASPSVTGYAKVRVEESLSSG